MTEFNQKCSTTEPYISQHLHWLGAQKGLAVAGTFEITSRCNFNCPMCYIHSSEKTLDEISAQQWLHLAEEGKKSGLMFLLLTGGEPFIRKDFAEIYTGLIEMGILVSVNTNASLYNEEIRALFKKYPPLRINVSLYGGSNECYHKMCGVPAFETVLNHIKQMKADGLNVRLNVSLTPHNGNQAKKIHAIAATLDLHSKATAYMYPPVRIGAAVGENAGRFTAPEAGRLMAYWHSLHDSPEKFTATAKCMAEPSAPPSANEESRCRAGRSTFWITADGKMLPCGTMNIESANPFAVGFEAAWQETRARVAAIRLPKKCAICPNRSFCGVCAAICIDETGSFNTVPQYMCALTENMAQEIIRIEKERAHANP